MLKRTIGSESYITFPFSLFASMMTFLYIYTAVRKYHRESHIDRVSATSSIRFAMMIFLCPVKQKSTNEGSHLCV